MFHEFLHAGNVPMAGNHNALYPGTRENDQVYACAAQAFPGTPVRDGWFGRYYVNTKAACETCAGGPHPACAGLREAVFRRQYPPPARSIRVTRAEIPADK